MSYPINDKVKAAKVKTDLDKELSDIMGGKKTYTQEIKRLRDKPIPQTLKDVLQDDRFGKEHAFEEMKCNHTDKNRLSMKNCERCQYDERELECETLIDNLNGNEKCTQLDENGLPQEKSLIGLKIMRGRYDDVVGYVWSWG